jgi:hypothetical protein
MAAYDRLLAEIRQAIAQSSYHFEVTRWSKRLSPHKTARAILACSCQTEASALSRQLTV